jgi:hypothetical protein
MKGFNKDFKKLTLDIKITDQYLRVTFVVSNWCLVPSTASDSSQLDIKLLRPEVNELNQRL